MDSITEKVRTLYEELSRSFGSPATRGAISSRMLMSYVERSREDKSKTIWALDAGCGWGKGVISCAGIQPDVEFLGVDVDRVALGKAQDDAKQRGFENVRFSESDLMTLEGVEVPEGGFDVIYSRDVIHHLADPLVGLQQVKRVLARHGVAMVSVAAASGRIPLQRLRAGLSLLVPESASHPEQLERGRELARHLATAGVLAGTPWQDTAIVDDLEFVHRALHVSETAYSIASWWQLLADAGMRFIRWLEPAEWDVCEVLPAGELRDRALALTQIQQYQLVETCAWRPSFQMIIAHIDNEPRSPIPVEHFDETLFSVSPDVRFIAETRNPRGQQRLERLAYSLRQRRAEEIREPLLAKGLLVLRDQNLPFTAASFVELMAQDGIPEGEARSILSQFYAREILYRPHATEI